LLGILATVTAAKKIGGDVDILVAGFSLESTVGKEAAAVSGKFLSIQFNHYSIIFLTFKLHNRAISE
jgi:hypothetical protein